MNTGTHIQKTAREFWRMLEVYLFFLMSVVGSTGFAKAPSSFSTKGKDYRTQNEIVRLVPLKSHAHVLSIPRENTINYQVKTRTYTLKSENSSNDDDAAIRSAGNETLQPHTHSISDLPFISPSELYHLLQYKLSSPHHFYSTHHSTLVFFHHSAPLLI